MALSGPRADGLPEGHDYRDDGCDLHPECLSCPLPACRYEFRQGALGLRAAMRVEAARRAAALGLPASEIAAALGVSRRTVFRDLAVTR